ncbi:MAG: hypothetical protein WC560_02135 [Syntrophales bacterium]
MLKMNLFSKKTLEISVLCALLVLVSITSCFSGLRERLLERRQLKQQRESPVSTSSACDGLIPEIKEGYGADGPYNMDIRTISNPLWNGEQISVFFPKGAIGQLPVILFSHAFGASDWKRAYIPFMRHMVSRGWIVVFSPYQTVGASFDERYATLWKGFDLAVQNFGNQMDLTRVGFVGHSFGGGATPAMAYKGLVKKGWGKKGAFIYILAPWYSFQISSEELRQLPSNVVMIMQVYDKDVTNDHRMALDIYRNVQLPNNQKHFQVVRSDNINGCEIVADHATPSRNPSLRLKQYSVFKTFDAVADYVFNGKTEGNQAISRTNLPSEKGSYQPLLIESNPKPQASQKSYQFPWDNNKNPRRSLESW